MGHTYKDLKEEYREDNSNNRYFRNMHHRKKHAKVSHKCLTGKATFPSIETANARATEIINEGAKDNITSFRAYKCQYCEQFHLTKQSQSL